jgi:hypothetical protein
VCIVVLNAEEIDQSWSTFALPLRYRMSALNEITREKQRISDALARVDAQREKLSGLRELEATARVLARYSEGTQTRKRASAKAPTTLLQHDQVGSRAPRSRNQLAASAVCRTSLTKSLPWPLARRSRKSPLHARALAPTMSALPFPGTSGPAESRSVTGSSTPRGRPERSDTPRSDSIEKRVDTERS